MTFSFGNLTNILIYQKTAGTLNRPGGYEPHDDKPSLSLKFMVFAADKTFAGRRA
jgi:hypothetical protein